MKLLATDWVIDLHMEGDYSELVYLLVFLSIYLISRVFEQFIMKEPTFPQEASCFHGTHNSRAHYTHTLEMDSTIMILHYRNAPAYLLSLARTFRLANANA